MNARVDWASVDLVLLDMDGTVLDLAFDNHFWGEVVPHHYAKKRGLSDAQGLAELEPHFRGLRGTLEWYSLEHWSRLTGLDLIALKREHRHGIAPRAGAQDFLRAARQSGRRLWLATNADPHALDIKLLHTGLENSFERLVSAHDFGAPKEDVAFWRRLLERHQFEPSRALFVDDSAPVLEAARAFGIGQVVAIRHPDTSRPARDVPGFPSVDRLADLLPVPAR